MAVPVFEDETAAATLAFVGTTAGIPADPKLDWSRHCEKRRHGFRANSGYAGGIEAEDKRHRNEQHDANVYEISRLLYDLRNPANREAVRADLGVLPALCYRRKSRMRLLIECDWQGLVDSPESPHTCSRNLEPRWA